MPATTTAPESSVHPHPPRLRTRPVGPIGARLTDLCTTLAATQHELVHTAAAYADSAEWVLDGATSAAAWLADAADVETCTAREWIRIGRALAELPLTAAAYADGTLSYSKIRAVTRHATPDTEAELITTVARVPASDAGRAIAAWFAHTSSPDELAAHHRRQRCVRWRTEPDGMVSFHLRLPPQLAATLIAVLSTLLTRTRPRREPGGQWPTVAQQHADNFAAVLDERTSIATEVVLHVRGDGVTCDDGTPIAETVIAELAPQAFLRALIHDAESRPVNASTRRRHPTVRQQRVVTTEHPRCVDCGRNDLLELDHDPPFAATGRTHTDELRPRCAPCHRRRHRGRR